VSSILRGIQLDDSVLVDFRSICICSGQDI
jgi:hypothetical protein